MNLPDQPPTTVAGAIRASISRFGPRTALVAADGATLSYAALGERIAGAVGTLRTLGCGQGDRIGIWLPNGLDWPVWQFACAISAPWWCH